MVFRERYIPEGDPEAKEYIEEQKAERQPYAFGEFDLQAASQAHDVEQLNKWLTEDRNIIATLAEAQEYFDIEKVDLESYIAQFFYDAAEHGMRDALLRDRIIVQVPGGKTLFTKKMFNPEYIRSIPDDVFLKMLECRKRAFDDREKALREWFPQLVEWFIERVLASKHRDRYSKDGLREQLSQLKPVLVDSLYAVKAGEKNGKRFVKQSHGAHVPDGNMVKIGSHVITNMEMLIDTVFHELSHAVLGRVRKATMSEGDEHLVVRSERTGIAFAPRWQGKPHTQRFEWMNEAFTDDFMESLPRLGLPEASATYKQEQELLRILKDDVRNHPRNTPIDTDNLFDAAAAEVAVLVEDDTAPEGTRLAKSDAWRKLSAVIRETYTNGFLVRLDKYVAIHGVAAAVEKMQAGQWREIHDAMGKPMPEST